MMYSGQDVELMCDKDRWDVFVVHAQTIVGNNPRDIPLPDNFFDQFLLFCNRFDHFRRVPDHFQFKKFAFFGIFYLVGREVKAFQLREFFSEQFQGNAVRCDDRAKTVF